MTTHGGVIVTGPETLSYQGIPVAAVGDQVICPLCSGVQTIVEGANTAFYMGRKIATHGDKTSCGATVISRFGIDLSISSLHTEINSQQVLCTGDEKTYLSNIFDNVPSYKGNLTSPFPYIILRYYEIQKILGVHVDISKATFERIDGYVISSKTVRQWVKDAAAHVRQLITQIMGDKCYSGELSAEQMEKIFSAYNGRGPAALKYGRDAMTRIAKAISEYEWLVFYEN